MGENLRGHEASAARPDRSTRLDPGDGRRSAALLRCAVRPHLWAPQRVPRPRRTPTFALVRAKICSCHPLTCTGHGQQPGDHGGGGREVDVRCGCHGGNGARGVRMLVSGVSRCSRQNLPQGPTWPPVGSGRWRRGRADWAKGPTGAPDGADVPPQVRDPRRGGLELGATTVVNPVVPASACPTSPPPDHLLDTMRRLAAALDELSWRVDVLESSRPAVRRRQRPTEAAIDRFITDGF